MKDETDVQKLMALKRYETPGSAYFESFLRSFQLRQRTEMMRCPAHRLVWERMNTWLWEFRGYRLAATGGVLAIGAGLLALQIGGAGEEEEGSAGAGAQVSDAPGGEADFQPTPVRVHWNGNDESPFVSGLEVADGMFVCSWPGSEMPPAVRVERVASQGVARVVMVDPSSGLVLLDGRARAMRED